jgi:hypothetical protein
LKGLKEKAGQYENEENIHNAHRYHLKCFVSASSVCGSFDRKINGNIDSRICRNSDAEAKG